MKRILFSAMIILFLGSAGMAQTVGTEMLYQKYRGEEGVVAIRVPGIVMRLAAGIADLERDEARLLRSIRSLRVLTIEEADLYPDVNFVREARFNPDHSGYNVMVQVHDSGEDVLIMGREKRGKLKDILILVGGDENVMVHIKGRMNADMIGSIAKVAGIDKKII